MLELKKSKINIKLRALINLLGSIRLQSNSLLSAFTILADLGMLQLEKQ